LKGVQAKKKKKMKVRNKISIFRFQPSIRKQLYFVDKRLHILFFVLKDTRIFLFPNHPNTRWTIEV